EVAVATILVHGGQVHVARDLVDGDLDVADETGVDRYRGVPGRPVVAGIGHKQGTATDSEVIPGNVHPVGKGRGRVVVDHARIAVVAAAGVNTEMGAASRV